MQAHSVSIARKHLFSVRIEGPVLGRCFGTIIPPTTIPQALEQGRGMSCNEVNVAADSFFQQKYLLAERHILRYTLASQGEIIG
jgi:hypothetical protein